jgi:hypothetical protein
LDLTLSKLIREDTYMNYLVKDIGDLFGFIAMASKIWRTGQGVANSPGMRLSQGG